MSETLVQLYRFADTKLGTFGTLTIQAKGWSCYTVERPWAGNRPRISCIPAGWYGLTRQTYHHGGYPTWGISPDPPGRSLIKIHRANFGDEVEGCIGLGLRWGVENGHLGVWDAHEAHSDFMDMMADVDSALLIVSWQMGA